MNFEWDDAKAKANPTNHDGLTFEEVIAAFEDANAILIDDPDHSKVEERSLLLGALDNGRIVVVSYTIRNDRIRIISARYAEPVERRRYFGQ